MFHPQSSTQLDSAVQRMAAWLHGQTHTQIVPVAVLTSTFLEEDLFRSFFGHLAGLGPFGWSGATCQMSPFGGLAHSKQTWTAHGPSDCSLCFLWTLNSCLIFTFRKFSVDLFFGNLLSLFFISKFLVGESGLVSWSVKIIYLPSEVVFQSRELGLSLSWGVIYVKEYVRALDNCDFWS